MKKIKYIICLFFLLIIVSCGDDSFSREYIDTEDKVELIGTITLTNPDLTTLYTDNFVGFTITVPQTFEVDARIEVTLKSTYKTLEVTANVEKIYFNLEAGSNTAEAVFQMPDFDNTIPFGGVPDFLSVSLTGLELIDPDPNDSLTIEDPYTLISETLTFGILEPNGTLLTPNNNTLMLSLDWEGPYDQNDLDLYVFDAGFTTVYESSESGSRFEGDFFNNPANENHPDGDYVIEVAIWTSVDDTTPIPWQLVLTHPDGTRDVYEGTVDPAIGYIDPVGFTQVTDGNGVRTFTTYPL